MPIIVNEKDRGHRPSDTAARLNAIRDVIGTSKSRGGPVTGHCMLVAEIKAGLVHYTDVQGRGPNDPRSIQALIDQCGGASWKYPHVKEGPKSEEIIRCHAPWHSGDEMPADREEEPVKPVSKSRDQATETHCKNGHEWTEENTYVDPRGSKVCRTCKREAAARHKARKEGRLA